MTDRNVAAVVLAAGEGKRMKSDRAKVLHEVAGAPMIDRVLETLAAAGVGRVVVVTGHLEDQVRGHLGDRAECVTQPERKGTGHAVMQAARLFEDFDGALIVACGDVPLLRSETLQQALTEFLAHEAAGLVLTTELENPAGYGRVLRDSRGEVLKIVEHKDASEAERAVREINSGTYCFDAQSLFDALKVVGNDNAQGEYYLTDVVEILLDNGRRVRALKIEDSAEAMGINSPDELARAEEALSRRLQAD